MSKEEYRSSQREERRPSSPEHGTRPRNGENPVLRWMLLDGVRWRIVVGVSVAVFAGFVALGGTGVVGVTNATLVTGVFTAAITGVFTLVSITVSINQLVLSRIMGSPEQIGSRRDAVRRFRADVEAMEPDVEVSPTEPAAFLEVVIRALRDRAARLREVYGEHHDPRLREDVDDLVETLLALTSHVDDHIETERIHVFGVLAPILNDSYSEHLYTARRIRENTDDLADAERRALDDLVDVLEAVNITRHYFKTLYIHEELANVSRQLLVTGLPAAVLSFVVILLYDGLAAAVGEPLLLLAVSASAAVVLSPLVILFVYGVRLATIAKRTTTFGTFTPVEEMP